MYKKVLGKASKLFVAAGLLVATSFVVSTDMAQAAACDLPATDMGSVSVPMTIPATGTYTIWTRMKAPDATHNSVKLQVDTTSCFNVGGGTFTAATWGTGSGNWIKYQDGSTANAITVTLNAGSHTFKYIGTQAGVEVDRVIASTDPSCVPTGKGDNCQSGDSTNPTVSLQAPLSGAAPITGTYTLKANAVDASGVASVQFLVDGNAVNTDVTSPYEYAWNSAGVANGPHTIAARATDSKNNTSTTAAVTVTVNNAVSCTGNPSVPGNPRATGKTPNSISLAWNASAAATGCTLQNYRIFRDGIQLTTVTGTTFTDSGLTPGKAYSYTIVAADTSNHVSAASAAVTETTVADTAKPSVPTNLRRTATTATAVGFAWNASTDNTGVKDYIIYRNGTQIGTSTTTTFTSSPLSPNTTYNFTVKARDLANNESDVSATLAAKTLAGTSANLGDLDGNNKVDFFDLSILLRNWSKTGVPISQGDVDGNGKVDFFDLSVLLRNWGKSL